MKYLIVILLLATITLGYILFGTKEIETPTLPLYVPSEGLLMVQGNSIKASVQPSTFNPQIFAIYLGEEPDLVYENLIDCIEWEESKRNSLAKGDKGYNCKNVLFSSPYCAFGSMQFWQETFQRNCINKYGLTDIWSREESRLCADLMIQERWNNVYQWTTAKRCLK